MSELIQDIHKELYKQIYKELCEKGYMTKNEFSSRIENKTPASMCRAMDGMGLFTYDDIILMPGKNEDPINVQVIRPFNRDDI